MHAPVKWTAEKIKALKGKQKIACLTAYDYALARILDESGVQLMLVGDSLAMTVLGYANTLPVTLEQMLHHTAAVARGVRSALVVADMPFMTYQVSLEQALQNAGRFLKESGADAVKVEGGRVRIETIQRLVQNGIPVLGHIGLTPQSIRATGGYKVQGRSPADADRLIEDARAIEQAGAFALVLETIPAPLAKEISAAISIPTIGIGAGPACDGQILVLHDILGLYGDFAPKFVKRYAELGQAVARAVQTYCQEVQAGTYPGPEHSYE